MRWILLLWLCLFSLPLMAQDEADDDVLPKNLIVFGEIVTGRLNSATPHEQFVLEALRCDFLSIRVRATAGNLDPVLSIFDEDGGLVFSRDDTGGRAGIEFEPLSIPSSGRYTVVVGRFGYRLGATTGTYELVVDRIGNGSTSGCAMRYGDTVTNNLNDSAPEAWYRFQGKRGDIVHVEMRPIGGSLDPVLTLADAGGFVMATNDDKVEGVINAEISSLLIPADGDYFIRAGRYGNTSGNFVLTLEEAINSGEGNSALAAIPVQIDSTVEGVLDNQTPAQYYRIQARQNDVISVRMERLTGNLDTFVVIANAEETELIENDDDGQGQNSRIDEFLIPADGTYFIIATRFERRQGRTSGRYRLRVEDEGNAFDEVPDDVLRLTAPITVTGSIDQVTPEARYVFWGMEGDRVTIRMNRATGDLDPLLRLLSGNEASLVTDDDGGRNQDALIERYRLPSTGIYYIVATRFGEDATTTGEYLLELEIERQESADE